MDASDVRRWLRTHRARLDVDQAQAAEALGVSRATWARWETGHDLALSGRNLVALARWAECGLEEVAAVFGLDQVEAPVVEASAP